jgi:hypothetical protein
MNLRYVVLHHTGVPDPHFDLMYEAGPGAPLITYRAPAWPVAAPTEVERLPDHRPAYLDYEGPVSDGRGDVRRVERGACRITISDNRVDVTTDRDRRLTFTREGPAGRWLLTLGQTPDLCR